MAESSVLPAVWEVPQEFRDRLGHQAGRQRAMAAQGHLLVILHRAPKLGEDERQSRFFWREPDGAWHCDGQGGGIAGLAEHLDTYAASIDQREGQEADAANSDDYFEVIQALGPLHRAADNMRAALQQARELCPADRALLDFRDRAYNIDRAAELLLADAKAGLDFAIARRTEEQAQHSRQMAVSAHRLNVLAAFFFPIATLSSVFGVNLLHGMENIEAPYAFLVVLGAGLLAGFVLKTFVTRST